MIEINLLPHREAKRAADLRQNGAVLVLGLIVAGGAISMVSSDLRNDKQAAEAQLRQLQSDIERYRPQEEKVGKFKKKRAQLEDKLDVIEGLHRARSGPVRIMDELARHTPERMWLTKLKTQGMRITVTGESLDTGVVADFLRELNSSRYFVNVDLDRTGRGKEIQGVKLVNFVITAELVNPSDEEEGKSA